jgi:cytochrome oxidase Cu insertion factor (SCO1/SenC/PrrC family)
MKRVWALLIVLWCSGSPLAAPADDVRAIPLVDQSGAVFRILDLRGRPALLTFVATRCTDACPIANVAFDRLRSRLQHDRIDPAYDTPFVMSRLAHSLRADTQDWVFASGRPADVERLMRSLGVLAVTGKSGIPDQHSTFVYVLDRRARLTRSLLLSTDIGQQVEQALAQRSVAAEDQNRGR